MKPYWQILCIASLAFAGSATCSAVQPSQSAGALAPQQALQEFRNVVAYSTIPFLRALASHQMLESMRSAAHDAAVTCSHFYDQAQRLQVRNPEMDKSLAAILRLRDAVRRYHAGFTWNYGPQSVWLRLCSVTLLDAWINVETSFQQLEPTPLVAGWWDQSQHSLVDLVYASSSYVGLPTAPLPLALGIRINETRRLTDSN